MTSKPKSSTADFKPTGPTLDRAGHDEAEFPTMKFVDCTIIGLKIYVKCMRIHFEHSNVTEFAGLSYFYGEESVLEGLLYDSELRVKERSRMSMDIGDDGNNCSVVSCSRIHTRKGEARVGRNSSQPCTGIG